MVIAVEKILPPNIVKLTPKESLRRLIRRMIYNILEHIESAEREVISELDTSVCNNTYLLNDRVKEKYVLIIEILIISSIRIIVSISFIPHIICF